MAKFGLVCEGITDQVVIENILCGFYKEYNDLDDEIYRVLPPFDDTDKKQQEGTGGWTRLFAYLNNETFLDDIIYNDYLIIQIDTDVSEEIGFEVSSLNYSTELPKVSKKLKVNKNGNDYDILSRPFSKHKILMQTVIKNSSFQIFISKLPINI